MKKVLPVIVVFLLWNVVATAQCDTSGDSVLQRATPIDCCNVDSTSTAGTIADGCQRQKTNPPGMAATNVLEANTIVYPNPPNDVLYMRFGFLHGFVEAIIYDMMGRIIDRCSSDMEPSVISFGVGQLEHGIYCYKIRNNGEEMRGIFIK